MEAQQRFKVGDVVLAVDILPDFAGGTVNRWRDNKTPLIIKAISHNRNDRGGRGYECIEKDNKHSKEMCMYDTELELYSPSELEVIKGESTSF